MGVDEQASAADLGRAFSDGSRIARSAARSRLADRQCQGTKELFAVIVLWVFVSIGLFSMDRAEAQTAANGAGDLWAENQGKAIWLWWENHSSTTEYMIYR